MTSFNCQATAVLDDSYSIWESKNSFQMRPCQSHQYIMRLRDLSPVRPRVLYACLCVLTIERCGWCCDQEESSHPHLHRHTHPPTHPRSQPTLLLCHRSKYKIHSGEFVEFDKDFAISLVLCVIVGPRDLTSLLHWHTQAPTLGPIHAPLLCYRPQCDARTVKPWPNNQMGAGLSGNPASPKLKRCGWWKV